MQILEKLDCSGQKPQKNEIISFDPYLEQEKAFAINTKRSMFEISQRRDDESIRFEQEKSTKQIDFEISEKKRENDHKRDLERMDKVSQIYGGQLLYPTGSVQSDHILGIEKLSLLLNQPNISNIYKKKKKKKEKRLKSKRITEEKLDLHNSEDLMQPMIMEDTTMAQLETKVLKNLEKKMLKVMTKSIENIKTMKNKESIKEQREVAMEQRSDVQRPKRKLTKLRLHFMKK